MNEMLKACFQYVVCYIFAVQHFGRPCGFFFKCYMNKFWYWMVTATEHLNLAKIKSDLRLLRVVFLLPYPLSSEIRFMIRRSDIFLKNLLLIIQHSFLRHWWQAFLAQTPQNKYRSWHFHHSFWRRIKFLGWPVVFSFLQPIIFLF